MGEQEARFQDNARPARLGLDQGHQSPGSSIIVATERHPSCSSCPSAWCGSDIVSLRAKATQEPPSLSRLSVIERPERRLPFCSPAASCEAFQITTQSLLRTVSRCRSNTCLHPKGCVSQCSAAAMRGSMGKLGKKQELLLLVAGRKHPSVYRTRFVYAVSPTKSYSLLVLTPPFPWTTLAPPAASAGPRTGGSSASASSGCTPTTTSPTANAR